MSLLETILSAQGGNLVKSLGQGNGINPQEIISVLGKLVPSLSQSVNNNAQQGNGLDDLFKALTSGNHQQYLEDEQKVLSDDARLDGNRILGHILGSKDNSRALASQVSADTGIASTLIKSLLPQVATLVMGALGSQNQSNGALGTLAGMLGSGQKSAAGNMLTSFLDRDQDGSIIDDVMAMAAKQMLK